MVQQLIKLGDLPNGVGGDTYRSANVKCNENFTELYEGLDTLDQRAARAGENNDITALHGLTTLLRVDQGGTGATNGPDVCRNIGALINGSANVSYGTTLRNSDMGNIAAISDEMNSRAAFTVSNGGNPYASAVITFHRDGQYGCHFGMDTDNQLKVGGWSMGGFAHVIWHSGNCVPGADGLLRVL